MDRGWNGSVVGLAIRGDSVIEIGSLVRHKRFGDIGVITAIWETRIVFIVHGKPWRTYKGAVEVLCE